MLYDEGKLTEANEGYQRAISLYTQLIQKEGRNDLIGMLAWVQTNTAETLLCLQETETVQALLNEAIPVLEAEYKRTKRADFQRVLIDAQRLEQQLNDSQ